MFVNPNNYNQNNYKMEYLDFEMPIKELEDQLEKCQIIGKESDVDVTATCKKIEKKLAKLEKIYIKI